LIHARRLISHAPERLTSLLALSREYGAGVALGPLESPSPLERQQFADERDWTWASSRRSGLRTKRCGSSRVGVDQSFRAILAFCKAQPIPCEIACSPVPTRSSFVPDHLSAWRVRSFRSNLHSTWELHEKAPMFQAMHEPQRSPGWRHDREEPPSCRDAVRLRPAIGHARAGMPLVPERDSPQIPPRSGR